MGKKGFNNFFLFIHAGLIGERSHKTRKSEKEGIEFFTLLFANCIVAKITVVTVLLYRIIKKMEPPISLFKEGNAWIHCAGSALW